eukprot:1032240-Prymnesium_polylepis.1
MVDAEGEGTVAAGGTTGEIAAEPDRVAVEEMHVRRALVARCVHRLLVDEVERLAARVEDEPRAV